MSDISKSYQPEEIEKKWYGVYKKIFRADPLSSKEKFCIVIPPPNVTGSLHMGHALVNTLQDILIRLKRMQGFEVLWQPGTDHAGIATQTVVEKNLMKETGKKRFEFTREEFLDKVWESKETHQKKILSQLEHLGCSCDWSRLRFTMDEMSTLAVRTLFKKMYDDGLIYQGDYLVNWDPITQTALADDEVEYEEKRSSLWFFRYPIINQKDYVVIATTRPETMLGDTAIAVHPEDPRFQSLIGKKVLLPLVNREIPIIADSYVQPQFGSGVVKITPAHDPNDYEIGIRHHLQRINIMTPNGYINENGGPFEGQSMQKARSSIVDAMKKLNFIEKIEPYTLRVGVSYRSKAIIEPYLSKQWFVKTTAFKEKLIRAVKDKKVTIIPPHWEETYYHWIENLRDWCISRQIWWGHQIPIWYNKKDPSKMICFGDNGIPPEVKNHPHDWVQDPDVLDTWFSSALWPLSSLGWPRQTDALQAFYPTSILVTGHDILFFWVARMILVGEYLAHQVPFHKAFIHGLIYGKSYWREEDGHIHYVSHSEKKEYDLGQPLPPDVFSKWEKMSKSKGNIIDPLEISQEFGTDALRMTLTASVTYARQIDLDLRRFEEFKNFANKIWNASRFVFFHLEEIKNSDTEIQRDLLTLEDSWILSRMNRQIQQITKDLEDYHFDRAQMHFYEFFWDEFCAYYLETCKPYLFEKMGTKEQKTNKQKILFVLLSTLIRLLHPIAPFITEELFQHLKKLGSKIPKTTDPHLKESLQSLKTEYCALAPYPHVIDETITQSKMEENFHFIQELIHAIRNIRSEMKLPLSQKTDLYFQGPEPFIKLLQKNEGIFYSLLKVETLYFDQVDSLSFGATAIVKEIKVFVPLPKDLQTKEIQRLQKEQEKLIILSKQTQIKLQNKDFLSKAPSQVIEKIQNTLKETQTKLSEIEEKLKKLNL